MDKKKELIMNYKQTHRPMGAFQIKDNINGKIFVGTSPNLDGIFNRHKFELEGGVHRNSELQKDWNEHGSQNFSFEVLEYLEPLDDPAYNYRDDLKVLEDIWLEKLQPFGEKGYNEKRIKRN